jgi:ABC-2 type transport system permease protein
VTTTPAGSRPPLTRLAGLEVRKILSTRSGVALAGSAALLPGLATVLALMLDDPPPNAPQLLGVFGTLAAVLLVSVGVLSTAGEWTHGTVQTTFLAVPQRGRVLVAKYAATALLGAAVAACVVAISLAAVAVGADADFGWAGTVTAVVATLAGSAALTVTGAGIGAASGNAPAALTGTYVTLLLGMSILNGLKPAVGRWVDPVSALHDLVVDVNTARTVTVLLAWVAVTTLTGVLVTRRRAVA